MNVQPPSFPISNNKQTVEFPINIKVTNEFNRHENIIIGKALDDWVDFSNGWISYNITYNWEPSIPFSNNVYKTNEFITVWKKHQYDEDILQLQVHFSMIANGFCLGAYVIIVNDVELTDRKLYNIFKHEFGHILGLSHIQGGKALMAPNGGGGIFTEYDLIYFCQLYDCLE